jgi:glycosyltransferase involved in cell wall biosynthesis
MISLIHPSRGRPQKSVDTFKKWMSHSQARDKVEFILSIDEDEPKDNTYTKASQYITLYNAAMFTHDLPYTLLVSKNKSAVDAINNAAEIAKGDVLMVVSDDTEPCNAWIEYIYHETNGKTDWILKTQDGIQPYIITMPIMDRAYYNRTGYIYHPDFQHLFCDTYLTCVADITGRKITSDLMFKHNHYSVNGTQPDELHKRNDSTWKQGQETFIRLMKEFTPEQRAKITDPGMKNWLRNKGVK